MSIDRLLPMLLLCATIAPGWAAETFPLGEGFEVRYAANEAITDEQEQQGWTPGYTVTLSQEDGTRVLSIDDTPDGLNIGQVYVGWPLDLGDGPVRTMIVGGEMQLDCATRDRTPSLSFVVLTRSAFEKLGAEGAGAPDFPRFSGREALSRVTVDHAEDVLEWAPLRSANLAARLQIVPGEELVLALLFQGNHAGSIEFGKFRNLEVTVSEDVVPPPPRERKYPLKTRRSLLTDDEIALARERVAEDEAATAQLDRVVRAAQQWLEVPDEDLAWRLPGPEVPRAFNVSAIGCPVHGTEVYKHGTYPWILDFDKPFQIECPVGHETYPSNDFLAYYQAALRGEKPPRDALAGDYPDDGWGWTGPNGERYWMVAYANHWFWSRHNIPGALNLSRAYVLTGDEKYAHKAAAMLARIADIYPGMDYEYQSRYGWLNPGYKGKILNSIWETGTVNQLAEAYDNIWETIDDDQALQALRGQTGEQIRELIETNLIEEAIDGILSQHIRGNFGMHQAAFAKLVAVRETAPQDELLPIIIDYSGSQGPFEGVRPALYNWVHRDGVPYETSPGYNFIWNSRLADLGDALLPAGIDLFSDPQMTRLMEWPARLTVTGTNMPAIGDSADIRHRITGRSFNVYRTAFEHLGGGTIAWWLQQSGGEERAFASYESLFEEDLREKVTAALAAEPRQTPTSRILDGYGMSILNNAADSIGVAMYYGFRGGHSHRDGLHFDLYAYGQAVTPDTGYPDFMNNFIPGIYTWSKATIAHNTVTVDAGQQRGNVGGRVHHFVDGDSVEYHDVDAPGNYPQTSEYRRAQALIATGEDSAYLLDVFRVAGGNQHDYSLHGTVGERTLLAGEFTPPQERGTLAGEDVEVGAFYDEPTMAAADYKGGYAGYHGSGFQHLEQPRRQTGEGTVVLDVAAAEEPNVNLRMHLPAVSSQQVILAEAQISPVKQTDMLPYALIRREGDNLQSTFVSVLEPYREAPQVQRVEVLPTADDAVALRVEREGAVDVILQARDGGTRRAAGDVYESDAALTVVTLEGDRATRIFAVDGTTLTLGAETIDLRPTAAGEVVDVDLAANTATVRWDANAPSAEELLGREIFLGNDTRDNVYEVTAAEPVEGGMRLSLRDSLRNGVGRVTELDEDARTVTTDARMLLQALYPGMRLANEAMEGFVPITAVNRGTFTLAGDAPLQPLLVDSDGDGTPRFWVAVTGPGDRARFERVTER